MQADLVIFESFFKYTQLRLVQILPKCLILLRSDGNKWRYWDILSNSGLSGLTIPHSLCNTSSRVGEFPIRTNFMYRF